MGPAAVPVATVVAGSVANRLLAPKMKTTSTKHSMRPMEMVFPSGRKVKVWAVGPDSKTTAPTGNDPGSIFGDAIQTGANAYALNNIMNAKTASDEAVKQAATTLTTTNPAGVTGSVGHPALRL